MPCLAPLRVPVLCALAVAAPWLDGVAWGGASPADDAASAAPAAEPPDEPEPEPGSAAARVTCLDDVSPEGSPRRGVQRRPFLKRTRFALSAVGGLLASDVLSSTYTFGGAVAFFPSEDFGVEALLTYAPVQYRLEAAFTSFAGERRFSPGTALQAVASLLYAPFHGKLKLSEETIIPADFFLIAGAGRTDHESVQGLTWEAGLGAAFYLGGHVSLRLDVRDFLTPQEVLGHARLANNVVTLAGATLWLP